MEPFIDELRESKAFLNLVLENVNSAVLIVDEDLRIHQFNKVFAHLFDQAQNRIVEKSFGNVTGCIHAVQENRACGKTSQCGACMLRRSLIHTLVEKVPADNIWLERVFYIDNQPVDKYLEFSTRHITFRGRKMILVIIYDVSDLEKQKLELQKKQRQLDQDLSAAAGIQRSLLPAAPPSSDAVQLAWKFEPCGQIGGDIFNIHALGKDHISLYMLDVCGHGVSAALISVSVSQFLQSNWTNSSPASPAAVLNSLKEAFPFERFDSFFSMVYVTIDFSRHLLTYSCAGHPPPMVIGPAGRMEYLDQRGPVIGVDEDHVYEQAQRRLHNGDRLVIYTDGILESTNGQGGVFGQERFRAAVVQHHGAPIQVFTETLYRTAKQFSTINFPEDDISLLVMDYRG